MCDDSKIKQSSALELVAYELPESSDCDQYPEIRKQYHTFGDIQRDAGKLVYSVMFSSYLETSINFLMIKQGCIFSDFLLKYLYEILLLIIGY